MELTFEKTCPSCSGMRPFCKACDHKGMVLTADARRLLSFLEKNYEIKPKTEAINTTAEMVDKLATAVSIGSTPTATVSQLTSELGDVEEALLSKAHIREEIYRKVDYLRRMNINVKQSIIDEAIALFGAQHD